VATLAVPVTALGAPKVLTQFTTTAKAAKSAKTADKAMKAFKQLGSDFGASPAVMDAIMNHTDEVEAAFKEMPDAAKVNLGKSIADNLKEIKNTAGKAISGFKKSMRGSNAKQYVLDDATKFLDRLVKQNVVNKVSALDSRDMTVIDRVRAMMDGPVSNKDVLKIIEFIDGKANYDAVAKGAISQQANEVLKGIRRAVKTLVREASPDGKEWAKADDVYSSFVEIADDLVTKFTGDSVVSHVQTLVNPVKEPLRNRLAQALELSKKIGVEVTPASEFLEKVKVLNAAEGLQGMAAKVADKAADESYRFIIELVKKYERKGELVGSFVGGALGGASGSPYGAVGGGIGGVSGLAVGGRLGKVVGGMIGKSKSAQLSDLNRLFTAVRKAKDLSADASKIAKKAEQLTAVSGPEAALLFLKQLSSIPPTNELVNLLANQEKR